MTVKLSLALLPSIQQPTWTRTRARAPHQPGLSGDGHVEGRFTHQRNHPVRRPATGLPHQGVAQAPVVRSDAQ